MIITVPGPPVPKGRARVFNDARGNVRSATPPATVAYEGLISRYALIETRTHNLFGKAVAVRLSVTVYEDARTPQRRGDLDNYIKSASDAIRGIVFVDDVQVERIEGRIVRDDPAPRMVIEVVPYSGHSEAADVAESCASDTNPSISEAHSQSV